jgi:hypothetical protein
VPEALVPSAEAIDRLLGTVRSRLEEALRNGQRVHVNAHAGMKQQVWRPGETNVVMEEDGSFSFTLWIEKKRS